MNSKLLRLIASGRRSSQLLVASCALRGKRDYFAVSASLACLLALSLSGTNENVSAQGADCPHRSPEGLRLLPAHLRMAQGDGRRPGAHAARRTVVDEHADVAFIDPELFELLDTLIVRERFGEIDGVDAAGGSSGKDIDDETEVDGPVVVGCELFQSFGQPVGYRYLSLFLCELPAFGEECLVRE